MVLEITQNQTNFLIYVTKHEDKLSTYAYLHAREKWIIIKFHGMD